MDEKVNGVISYLIAHGQKESAGDIMILQQQNAVLRKALEFYANRLNWSDGRIDSTDFYLLDESDEDSEVGGRTARTALEEIKKMEQPNEKR